MTKIVFLSPKIVTKNGMHFTPDSIENALSCLKIQLASFKNLLDKEFRAHFKKSEDDRYTLFLEEAVRESFLQHVRLDRNV